MQPRLEFDALGTHWWMSTAHPLPPGLSEAVLLTVRHFEANYSRFQPDSLLSQLNDHHRLTDAPAELLELIEYGLSAYDQTDGVMNMSVGARLEQAGYGRPAPADTRLSTDLRHDVVIDDTTIRVAPWVRLDFGGFGKGWLVDKLADQLRAAGVTEYIVNGGGDIAVGSAPAELIIEHPRADDHMIGTVGVTQGALASSSALKRVWHQADGRSQTHIQAVTSHRADELLSVHVRTARTREADMLATVFLLVDHGRRLALARQFDAKFLEVRPDHTFWQTPGFGFTPVAEN